MRFSNVLRLFFCVQILYKGSGIAFNENSYGSSQSRSTSAVQFNGFWKPFQKTSMNFDVRPRLFENIIKIIAFILLFCSMPHTKMVIQKILRKFANKYSTKSNEEIDSESASLLNPSRDQVKFMDLIASNVKLILHCLSIILMGWRRTTMKCRS